MYSLSLFLYFEFANLLIVEFPSFASLNDSFWSPNLILSMVLEMSLYYHSLHTYFYSLSPYQILFKVCYDYCVEIYDDSSPVSFSSTLVSFSLVWFSLLIRSPSGKYSVVLDFLTIWLQAQVVCIVGPIISVARLFYWPSAVDAIILA